MNRSAWKLLILPIVPGIVQPVMVGIVFGIALWIMASWTDVYSTILHIRPQTMWVVAAAVLFVGNIHDYFIS